MSTSNVYLQLGDIIQINAPSNLDLNEHIFLIDYIDTQKMKLIDEQTMLAIVLNIKEDGNLSDESITSISILNRSEHTGYAKQNNLLPDTWVDIHFGGDLPLTITGRITNLEEDMIELKTYMDNDIIYIDFGYKGIPENIPIDKIVIRSKPEEALVPQVAEAQAEPTTNIPPMVYETEKMVPDELSLPETQVNIPVQTIKAQLKDILLEADQIEFGPDLQSITQIVEVPEEQKRFSIETQTNDLLDELLSSIPNVQRTRTVLNSIHTTIERFKQLRNQFSQFDSNGNAILPKTKGANFKPLVDRINKLNFKLYWIIPIAQNVKKVYDMDISDEFQVSDIVPMTLAQSRLDEHDIREFYMSNTDNFYSYMNKLQPYLTPFDTNYNTDSIHSLSVQTVSQNIDAVIDNLGKFHSSIAKKDSIRQKRFVINKYNLGLSKLQTTQLTSSVMKAKVAPMTSNDIMSVKSIMTLPEPTVQFSNINLPSTNIYDKSNLNQNFLNYWQLLRNNSSITTKFVDKLNENIEFDDVTYLKHMTEYLLTDTNDDPEKFEKYLNIIIPKTRVLFNLIKKYINGKLSFVSVVNYLQPFLIYIDDISFKQYEEITEYIEKRILNYKKQFAENREIFNKLTSTKSGSIFHEVILYKLLKGRNIDEESIFEEYGFDNNIYSYTGDVAVNHVLTSSEILKRMMDIDYTKFFNTSINVLNLDLFTPFDFDTLLNQKQDEIDKKIHVKEKDNECKQYVLTKRYIDLDDLNADNDVTVYVDKKYDSTVYTILNEYKQERTQMDETAFKNFLADELMKNIGLKRGDAKIEAKSMVDGKREVQDGQYAVLEIDNIDNIQYYYYKRENNKWIRDETIPSTSFFGTNNMFCNIQDKCIKIDKTCADKSLGTELIKKDIIKEIYDEFDTNYTENIEQYKQKVNSKFQLERERVFKLRQINTYLRYKYENQRLKLTQGIEDSEITVSPHTKQLSIILGYSDLVIKYNCMVKFINKYTRSPIVANNEDTHWLYCVDTNTKLLPTFVQKLATVFVENGNFLDTLEQIKQEQGVDIDNITFDKYSGWEISKITLSSDEGYDEAGFKNQSREILEKDAGAVLLQAINETIDFKHKILSDPKGRVVNNIITSMSNYLGIVLDNQREEIIKHVLLALEDTVDSEEVYERLVALKLKEGVKMKAYADVFNTSLLTYTLSYLALYIQISIPSVQSKKTHPGCKRSFIGYPLTGEEDLSNLQYIACVAADIKTSQYPWKAIPKNKDRIVTAMKNSLDAYILKQSDVQVLLDQKRSYLLQNEHELIPVEHDIKKWVNFLPPLQNITSRTPTSLNADFKNMYVNNLKKGTDEQFEQLRVIQSKIIHFSMAIVQSIHSVVEKENLLLTNNNLIPFLQNACCNTGEYKAIDYFTSREPNITKYNDIVTYLNNIIFDTVNVTKSAILLDSKDTKHKFPPVNTELSEDTIYRAFIEYCNFNNDIPINDKLMAICLNKPETYDKDSTIQDKIKLLKSSGRTYSMESFTELLDIVNKMNIVPMDMIRTHSSDIQQMRDLIQYMKDNENSIGTEFLDLLKNCIDTYDIENGSDKDNEYTRKLRNYLGKTIGKLQVDIYNYMNKHADFTKTSKQNINDFIMNIMVFHKNSNNYYTNEDDETLYRAIQFIRNSMFNFVHVFPTVIMNHVDYSNIKIPSHWKLSQTHELDIKNIIKEFYVPLKRFYEDVALYPILLKNQSDLKDIFMLAKLTHLYSNIILQDNSEIKSILDNKTISQLFEFYFLYMIYNLITMTTNRSLVNPDSTYSRQEDNEVNDEIEEPNDDIDDDIEVELDAVTKGQQKRTKDKLASLIATMLDILKNEKQKINLNAKMIKDKIMKSKDKERHKITSTLRDMTKEEREIENLFKNHRLERWNKGLQKGLTQYVAKTYDEEREDREKDDIMERHLVEREMLGQASTANREIELLEEQEREVIEQQIDADVYAMDDFPEDDDMGEEDYPYMLNYDDNE